MRHSPIRRSTAAFLSFAFLCLSSCSLHSVATSWNGRVGPDGKPVFVTQTTNIGCNALVFIPMLGSVTLDSMFDTTSAEVASRGGDRLRTIETGSENYWYGVPPLTWILTPVITTVSIEYQPSEAEWDAEMKRQGKTLPYPR
jgi:hypothetical protein